MKEGRIKGEIKSGSLGEGAGRGREREGWPFEMATTFTPIPVFQPGLYLGILLCLYLS